MKRQTFKKNLVIMAYAYKKPVRVLLLSQVKLPWNGKSYSFIKKDEKNIHKEGEIQEKIDVKWICLPKRKPSLNRRIYENRRKSFIRRQRV